jgi:hypothetical protein
MKEILAQFLNSLSAAALLAGVALLAFGAVHAQSEGDR